MSEIPVAKPVERLFSPFWASIAIEPVKDLLSNPQTIQYMAELLEISVNDFLLLTQAYTLPWLLLWQKADVIERIASLRGDVEVWRVYWDTKNLVPTLGLLLLQNVPDVGKFTWSLFRKVSPGFDNMPQHFDDLIKADVGALFLHLLRLAGEADEVKKTRVSTHISRLFNSNSYLQKYRHAMLWTADRIKSNGDGKTKKPFGAVMEEFILGWVTLMSYVINDIRNEHSSSEKRRDLRAIEEMVRMGKSSTRLVRPQVRPEIN